MIKGPFQKSSRFDVRRDNLSAALRNSDAFGELGGNSRKHGLFPISQSADGDLRNTIAIHRSGERTIKVSPLKNALSKMVTSFVRATPQSVHMETGNYFR